MRIGVQRFFFGFLANAMSFCLRLRGGGALCQRFLVPVNQQFVKLMLAAIFALAVLGEHFFLWVSAYWTSLKIIRMVVTPTPNKSLSPLFFFKVRIHVRNKIDICSAVHAGILVRRIAWKWSSTFNFAIYWNIIVKFYEWSGQEGLKDVRWVS